MSTNIQKRIAHNISTHVIEKPNGKRVTVKSSDKYVEQRVLGNALGLAFARVVAGREFAR